MAMLRTPLAIVRGHGSAKDGTHHFWAQRLTALALVPLTLWFAARVVQHAGADHAEMVAWLSSPADATLMLLLIAAVFHHAHLGVQVVIEDYVQHEGLRIAGILVVKAGCAVLGVACAVSVLKLWLGG